MTIENAFTTKFYYSFYQIAQIAIILKIINIIHILEKNIIFKVI